MKVATGRFAGRVLGKLPAHRLSSTESRPYQLEDGATETSGAITDDTVECGGNQSALRVSLLHLWALLGENWKELSILLFGCTIIFALSYSLVVFLRSIGSDCRRLRISLLVHD